MKRLALIGFGLVLMLAACADGSEGSDGTDTTATTATTVESAPTTTLRPTTTTTLPPTTTTTLPPTTTTTLPPTTTTTQPTTTTTLAPIEGSSDDFFEFFVPGDEPAVLDISHDGGSNFVVKTYDANNEPIDLLVNEIGSYQGRVPVNFLVGEDVAFIEITASGPWTIEIISLFDLPSTSGSASGRGDDVVVVQVFSPALDITHDGDSNFVVRAWTNDDRDLLVNEIGKYDGTVRSPTGTVIFEINADGNWAISEG